VVLGSIAAGVVFLIAIGVMSFNRQEATQTLTTDRGPASSSAVATTVAKDHSDASSAGTSSPTNNALYERGQQYYLSRDYDKAAKAYRQAADAGHARAQAKLGEMYAAGEGVPPNDAEAVKWYREAANQGDVEGQYYLGVMYDSGRGVTQDNAKAVEVFRKAAQQGDEFAQGVLRIRGLNW
jgi:TPR repeat protein